MHDAERQRLLRLADWRPAHGVISAYFEVDHGDRSASWRVMLKDGLGGLAEPPEHEAKVALRETVQRMLHRFDPDAEPPPGRAQVGFVEVGRKGGVDDWSSLQIPLRETIVQHQPRPLLAPLIDLWKRARPHAVLAVSAERVRGWVWERGRLEPAPDWDAELGIYPGRERKGATPPDPARGGAVSSSGRDQFAQRLEENRKRFLRDVAKRLGEDARFRSTQLIAVGEAPSLTEFTAAVPSGLQVRTVEGPDVIGEPDGAIAKRVGREVEQNLERLGAELARSAIDAALARAGRGAVGVNETSEALAEGRVDHLLLDLAAEIPTDDLTPAARDGVRDGSALGGAELLIELALRTSADVTLAFGVGAETLREHGGAAALLRY